MNDVTLYFKDFVKRHREYIKLAETHKKPRIPYKAYRQLKDMSELDQSGGCTVTIFKNGACVWSEATKHYDWDAPLPQEYLDYIMNITNLQYGTATTGFTRNDCDTSSALQADCISTNYPIFNYQGPGDCCCSSGNTYSTTISSIFDADHIKQLVKDAMNTLKEEDKPTMKLPNMNFEFGPINDDSVVMSPCGLAIQKPDRSYVAYNKATDKMVDVTGLTFNIGKVIYKMPVAMQNIAKGDLIYHNGRPVYVVGIDNGIITAIDYVFNEQKVIVPVSNIFGFDYLTKIISVLNLGGMQPDPNNPFGNIMPLVFMNAIFGEGKDDLFEGDLGKLMMMSMFMGGQNPFGQLFAGPIGNSSDATGKAAAANPFGSLFGNGYTT